MIELVAEETLAQLKGVKEENPELTSLVDLQAALLEAQIRVAIQLDVPEVTAEGARERLQRGLPLLAPPDVALDWETFTRLYQEVCGETARVRPELASQAEECLALLVENPEGLRALTESYLENGRIEPEESSHAVLLPFVLNQTARPFLQACARDLAPLVEQALWQRGHCPICGGEPDLAYLDDATGARHLVCARCDYEWGFPRVKCPYCNTSEPSNITYTPSHDGRYRLYLCGNCRRYLKAIDQRKTLGPMRFPVERIRTAAADVAAREDGYS
jgi:FdhE protein